MSEPGDVPANWRDKLLVMSPRNLQLGDRLMLPAAYPEIISWSSPVDEYLSGPVTWLTEMSEFRSGHVIYGKMEVHFTDGETLRRVHYDFYGIDFVTLYVYRP